MKIQTFKNMTGLIHGSDNKRIGCVKEGVLRIGSTEVSITPEKDSVMPILFNGWTGSSKATFTDNEGNIFDLGQVAFKNGRVVSPRSEVVEIAELRARVDLLENENASLWDAIQELRNIFDTNSLNFLIK